MNKYKVNYYENGILKESIIEALSYENIEHNGVLSTRFNNVFNTSIGAILDYADIIHIEKIEEGR